MILNILNISLSLQSCFTAFEGNEFIKILVFCNYFSVLAWVSEKVQLYFLSAAFWTVQS